MPYQRIKFYQTGTFTAGNRLLDPEQRAVQAEPGRPDTLTCGHRVCQGCGEALGARYALDAVMRATGGKMIAVNATGCLEVFSTPFPETSWQIAWLHSLFGNAPAVASGVAAALRAARTATTQAVGDEPGNVFGQGKNVPLIAMAHEIPYLATATVADLRDLEYKATRAMEFRGTRYLHILVPCPLGWGSKPGDTIKVARLAVESALFPVFEAENGSVVSSTMIRHQVPVSDYLRLQARYSHLFRPVEHAETIARIQAIADRNLARFNLLNHNGRGAPDE